MKRLLIAILTVALASLWLGAQEKPAEKKSGEMKHDHAAMEKKGAPPAAQPSPEITKLIKMFSGTWTTSEKFEPSPMIEKGGSSKGTATFKAGPGGNSLFEDYSSPHGALGPFRGHAVIWWDAKEKVVKGVWCDSMAPTCMIGGSKWEGENLVSIPQEMDMGGGQKMVMTSKYSDIKPDSFTYTMGMGPSADKAKTSMTIVYSKAGKTTAPVAKKGDETPTKK